jgi:hypothetical protein
MFICVYFLFHKRKYRLDLQYNSTDILNYVALPFARKSQTSCITDFGLTNTIRAPKKVRSIYVRSEHGKAGGSVAQWSGYRRDIAQSEGSFGFLHPTASNSVTLLLQKYTGHCVVTQ